MIQLLKSRMGPLYSRLIGFQKDTCLSLEGEKGRRKCLSFTAFKIFIHSSVISEARCLTAAGRVPALRNKLLADPESALPLPFRPFLLDFSFIYAYASHKDWEATKSKSGSINHCHLQSLSVLVVKVTNGKTSVSESTFQTTSLEVKKKILLYIFQAGKTKTCLCSVSQR